VNLSVTVLLALSMMAAKTLLGSASVQPLVINAMIRILWAAAALQLPMLLILAYRIGAFKKGAGLWVMRAAGLVALFVTLLHAPGVGESPSSGAPEASALSGGEAQASQGSDCGPVCEAAGAMGVGGQDGKPSAPRWWESALEALFAASGNELALKGLKVARGEKLTEAEKQRIRELAAAEQEAAGDAVLQAKGSVDADAEGSDVPVHVVGEAAGECAAAPNLREKSNEGSVDVKDGEEDGTAEIGENVAAEGVGGDSTDISALQKLPPSLFDMLPAKAQPLALLATLIVPIVTLVVQLRGLGDTVWVRKKDMKDEEQVLMGSHARKASKLAGLVATAFEESLIRRDSYIQILSAALAAIGSAQGILRILHDKDWPKVPTLSSSMMLRVSQTNGYMVWMGISSLLSRLGQYDRSAILYLSRPKASSPWGAKGMVQGRVSAHLDKLGRYKLAVLVKLEDGASVRHEACLELQDFMGAEKGSLRQRDFVDAVRDALIDKMPWV